MPYPVEFPNAALFAERLRALRKARQWKQVTMGEKSGIASQQICSYERGRILPSIGTLYLLACTFKVSSDYLLGLQEKP